MADEPHTDCATSSFEVGDIVELKSGGIAMTAGELDPRKGRRCVWSVKDGIKEKFFRDGMLRPSQELQLPPNIIVQIADDRTIRKYRTALEIIAAGVDDPRAVAVEVLCEVDSEPGEQLP